MKTGYNTNSYFQSNGWNYTFCRKAHGFVWSCDNTWSGPRTNTGWSYGSDWEDYALLSDGSSVSSYWQNSTNKVDSAQAVAFNSSVNLVLETDSGTVGSHQIEYIAFYN